MNNMAKDEMFQDAADLHIQKESFLALPTVIFFWPPLLKRMFIAELKAGGKWLWGLFLLWFDNKI